MGKKLEIKAGDKFGKWTVLEEAEPIVYRRGNRNITKRRVKVQCECGVEKEILVGSLSGGYSKSCGCLMRELAAVRILDVQKIRVSRSKHLKRDYPELYTIINNAIQRCTNPNDKEYKNYGGRGIKVCEEWMRDRCAFILFALSNGWKKGLQMDRKDNNGDYEPSNIHFVEPKINARNKRNTLKDGTGTPLIEVYENSQIKRVGYDVFAIRVKRGWDIERALTTMPLKRRSANV